MENYERVMKIFKKYPEFDMNLYTLSFSFNLYLNSINFQTHIINYEDNNIKILFLIIL